MGLSESHQFCEYTFLQIYEKNVKKKLQKIDLFLKTSPEELNISSTAELLDISEYEVRNLMVKSNIESITPASFFMIMIQGSSYICGLLKRELARGSKTIYTIEDISYIYQLNPQKVRIASEEANISQITSKNMNTLFSYIPVHVWE